MHKEAYIVLTQDYANGPEYSQRVFGCQPPESLTERPLNAILRPLKEIL